MERVHPLRLAVLGLCAALVLGGCARRKPTPPPAPPPTTWQPAPTPTPAPPSVAAPQEPARDRTLPPATFADDDALVKALRAGGYILALRHTHTDMTQKDDQGEDYADCAKQRNLDEQGRAEAKQIGEAFVALKLPIAEVLTSPFCRNKETAELAFGTFTVHNACMGEDEASIGARRLLLGTPPPAGQNIVIVTHRHSMAKSTGSELDTMGEGGALVIVPKGDGEFEFVHTIAMEDWKRLADVARSLD